MTTVGHMSDPIYIVADEDMKKDEIDMHSITAFLVLENLHVEVAHYANEARNNSFMVAISIEHNGRK